MPLVVTKEVAARGTPIMGRAVPAAGGDAIDRAAASIAAVQADRNKRLDALQAAYDESTAQIERLVKANAKAEEKSRDAVAAIITAHRKTDTKIEDLAGSYEDTAARVSKLASAVAKSAEAGSDHGVALERDLTKLLAAQSNQIATLNSLLAAQKVQSSLVEEIARIQTRDDKALADIVAVLSSYGGEWLATVVKRDTKDRILTLKFSEAK